ncbi:MAG: dimethylmenaquinone methyltransferase [Actinomycetota bacterium]|nr:dimethylmenaquinone methyltransferase [Actinomycetota bacterium]
MSDTPQSGDLATTLLALGAATLGESGGRPMHPRIRPAWPGAVVAAPAYCVNCARADNLAVHAAVTCAPAGSVLVVDVAPPERGYWGEVLTTAAEARGLRGLIIDGGVRDVTALESHRFPVFCTLVALAGAEKVSGGQIGGSAVVGDVEVHTGDWILADRDGVIVIAGADLDAVVERGRARAEKEAAMFTRLRSGVSTVELLRLDVSEVVVLE